MNVGELLKILSTCPQDALILMEGSDFSTITAVAHHATLKHVEEKVRYYDEVTKLPETKHLVLCSVPIKNKTASDMEFIRIPAGQFIIGNEQYYMASTPMRKIYLDEYEIGKYPVTNREYAEFTGNLVGEPDHPVVNVSWYGAMEYCKWLSEKTGSTITLPTEAQFVKAARGGIWLDGVASKKVRNPLPRRKYPWGNERPTMELSNCNCREISSVTSHPKGASPYGCCDMVGNVWQWCLDSYDKNYRIILGSSWICPKTTSLEISARGLSTPSSLLGHLGFRCVRLKGK